MGMKTSVVIADGTFPTNTAPLLGSIDAVFRQASELGYDAVSVTVQHPEEVDVAALNKARAQYGVAISGLATGRIYTVDGFSLGSGDEANRQEAVDRMLGHARLCAELGGAKLIIGAVRGWTKDAGGREAYVRQFRKSMETLVRSAEELGIQVLLEAISRMDSDAYCTIDETAEYIRSFHSPALQLQLDSIHIHTNGETGFYEKILRHGDLIGQVDISDWDRMAPDGRHFDFPTLLKALHEVGYEGYLLSEYRAAPPENAAQAGLAYLKTLL